MRDHCKNETTCVHRLDAGTRVRADVSDALLRLVDESGGQEIVFAHCMVAAGWDAAGATIYCFGGSFVRAGDGKIAGEGDRTQHNRETNHSARSGNFWARTAVSGARIRAGLSLVAVDGSAARRCAKHYRAFHDAHGCAVLGD